MSGDCDGCIQKTTEIAEVVAALVRRLGDDAVELTAEELGRFNPNTSVVFTKGDADGSLKVAVHEEAWCES